MNENSNAIPIYLKTPNSSTYILSSQCLHYRGKRPVFTAGPRWLPPKDPDLNFRQINFFNLSARSLEFYPASNQGLPRRSARHDAEVWPAGGQSGNPSLPRLVEASPECPDDLPH